MLDNVNLKQFSKRQDSMHNGTTCKELNFKERNWDRLPVILSLCGMLRIKGPRTVSYSICPNFESKYCLILQGLQGFGGGVFL